jgi:hypothetical protein
LAKCFTTADFHANAVGRGQSDQLNGGMKLWTRPIVGGQCYKILPAAENKAKKEEFCQTQKRS